MGDRCYVRFMIPSVLVNDENIIHIANAFNLEDDDIRECLAVQAGDGEEFDLPGESHQIAYGVPCIVFVDNEADMAGCDMAEHLTAHNIPWLALNEAGANYGAALGAYDGVSEKGVECDQIRGYPAVTIDEQEDGTGKLNDPTSIQVTEYLRVKKLVLGYTAAPKRTR